MMSNEHTAAAHKDDDDDDVSFLSNFVTQVQSHYILHTRTTGSDQ